MTLARIPSMDDQRAFVELQVPQDRLLENFTGAAFESLPLPAALLDARTMRFVAANGTLRRSLGYSESELIGQPLAALQDRPSAQDGLVRLRGRNGRELSLYQHVAVAEGSGGSLLVWTAHPSNPEVDMPQIDPLTGLMTRRAFEWCLRARMATHVGTLIYIEVDQFKLVNDAYGREAGNDLLTRFGRLLQSLIREGDQLAYLGGDEFGLLLYHSDTERAWQVAERVRFQVAAQGFEWRGRSYGVTVSVGIASFSEAAQDFTELLSAADAACRAAKENGRNRIEIYRADDGELQRVRGEQSWGARVLEVLEGGRFALFRQRIMSLNGAGSGGLDHYEVLLRPQGALGWTLPGELVLAAERYGLMAQLDRRIVLRTLRWLSQTPETQMPSAAVNLSGSTLTEGGFAAFVARALEETGVEPGRLRFEITETSAIANIQRAVALVSALRELGCHVALDDFGSGMSSFAYLKTLAVDTIKIDGSFVRGVATDDTDAATVDAIARLARLRGLTTVAECVEDESTLSRLRDIGIDYAQGFHLHRPEPWSLP
ncbi:MAG TPA: EAL domain-containing protein [Solimonas sp.]